MKGFLGGLLAAVDNGDDAASPTRGDVAYDRAMRASDDLLERMKEAGREMDAVRAVMADILSGAQNVPFMTTVYQAVQEAKVGPDSMRESGRYVPIRINGRGHRHS